MMIVAKSATFLALLLSSAVAAGNDAQLLCFGATWCQPCQEMKPILNRLASEGFPIRKIDVDRHRDLASRYQISTLPAFVMVDRQGRKVDQLDQATSYDTLRRFFAHYQVAPSQQATTVRGQSPEPSVTAAAPVATHWNSSATGEIGSTQTPPESATDLSGIQRKSLAATVRIRVEDEGGHSFGTGTVVDIHGQEALVLTCGHIFRESQGKGRILMERFDVPAAEPALGTLISYDIDRDVALLSMKLTRPMEIARLAPLKEALEPGSPIYSIGCNQGAPPTLMEGRVNQIDKYLGPPNITASGRPVVGRSGGGLFNERGELVGVCSAADPEIDEGIYAALPRVYYELDRNGLSFVYQNQQRSSGADTALAHVASTDGIPNLQEPQPMRDSLSPQSVAAAPPSTATSWPSTASSLGVQGTTDRDVANQPADVGRRQFNQPVQFDPSRDDGMGVSDGLNAGGELVCVLKDSSGKQGNAYVIKNPSPALLRMLEKESQPSP